MEQHVRLSADTSRVALSGCATSQWIDTWPRAVKSSTLTPLFPRILTGLGSCGGGRRNGFTGTQLREDARGVGVFGVCKHVRKPTETSSFTRKSTLQRSCLGQRTIARSRALATAAEIVFQGMFAVLLWDQSRALRILSWQGGWDKSFRSSRRRWRRGACSGSGRVLQIHVPERSDHLRIPLHVLLDYFWGWSGKFRAFGRQDASE